MRNNPKSSISSLYECSINDSILKRSVAQQHVTTTSRRASIVGELGSSLEGRRSNATLGVGHLVRLFVLGSREQEQNDRSILSQNQGINEKCFVFCPRRLPHST